MNLHSESRVRSFNADPMASLRLAWLVKRTQERIGPKVTLSAVIRRALHIYQAHMDALRTEEAQELEFVALTQALINRPAPIGPESVDRVPLEGSSFSEFIARAAEQTPVT